MNAHAYSLNPMERDDYGANAARIAAVVAAELPHLVRDLDVLNDALGEVFYRSPEEAKRRSTGAFQHVAHEEHRALMEALRDGDWIAFGELFDRHAAAEAVRYALSQRICDEADVGDEFASLTAMALRLMRAARDVPKTLPTLVPPRAPGFLTNAKGE